MAEMGFSAEAVARMRSRAKEAEPDTGFPVHPDNGAAVRLLLASATQWRTVVLSTAERSEIRRTGLDYGALEPTARMAGLTPTPDDFLRLRTLEGECLKAWSEART